MRAPEQQAPCDAEFRNKTADFRRFALSFRKPDRCLTSKSSRRRPPNYERRLPQSTSSRAGLSSASGIWSESGRIGRLERKSSFRHAKTASAENDLKRTMSPG